MDAPDKDILQPMPSSNGNILPPASCSKQVSRTEYGEFESYDHENEYPEGGKKVWLVVLGAWCAMVPSMGWLNTLAILQAWLTEHDLKGKPESATGWILSTYAFCVCFCSALVGSIFDSYDIKILIIPGSVGIMASMICLSFSHEIYQYLLSFGILGGISASLLFTPSLAAVGHWFQRRRAFATGLACTAGGLGGIGFPLIIKNLAPRIGFEWAIRVIALICSMLLAVACCLLRKRLPPKKKAKSIIDLKALLDVKFGTTTLAIFLIEFAVFIPYSYISSYAIYYAYDPQEAYLLNVYLNVGAVPGRALPGYFADRFGAFNTMCLTAFACAILVLGLWLNAHGNESMTMAFTVLFGFWSGAAISLTPVCVSQVCRIEDYGKRSGTVFFISGFGALIGIPLAGAILDLNGGSYQGLIIFAGATYVVGMVAFVIARGLAGGWRIGIVF